jgi:zinc transport system substrate-binding protein
MVKTIRKVSKLMKRRACCFVILLFIPTLFLLFLLGGCSYPEGKISVDDVGDLSTGEEQLRPVKVVTTIFPLASILKEVGGNMVEVVTLLPAGSTPHTYEPAVEHAKAVAKADLIVFVGGGLDDWALSIASAAEKGSVLGIMDSLGELVLEDAGESGLPSRDEVAMPHAGHSMQDPHLWLDPVLVREKIAPLLAEELKLLRPEEEKHFTDNLKIFQTALGELDEEITAAVEGLSQARFISYHSAWNYFARRYGLQEVAAVEEFPGREPSGKWLAELVHLSRAHNIKVIFAEPQLSSKAADVIAKEIGGRVFFLDPLGGPGLPGREGYLELMRYNLKVFEEALR